MARIAIIGAGAGGLAAAYDLVRAGHHLTLFEASNQVGGLAAGFKDERWAWTLEKFYHHWFESDVHLLQLAQEMGVREKIIFPLPKTSYWINGKVYRSEVSLSPIGIRAGLALPISLIGKLRLGLGGVYLKLVKNWRTLEKYTAHEWLSRTMGREVYETIWRPLLIGKFGEFYQEVNMAWLWARIHSRTLRLGTFEGGFQAFLEILAQQVAAKGALIRLSTPVEKITAVDKRFSLVLGNGQTEMFDAVLSTTSPRLLRRMVTQIEGDYMRQLDALRSMGAVVVIVALKHQLLRDHTYWLNLPASSADKTQSQFPFLALVEHTNYMKPESYNGDRLVYCGDYVPAEHEYFKIDEEELAGRFIAELSKFNPDFSREWIRRWWVFRAPYAQPMPTVNHSQNIPALRTPLRRLYWASMSQVYPWDRGTNYAVEIGRRAARMMIEDLQNTL